MAMIVCCAVSSMGLLVGRLARGWWMHGGGWLVFYGGIEVRPVTERVEAEKVVLEEAWLYEVGLLRNCLKVWRVEDSSWRTSVQAWRCCLVGLHANL